MNSRLTTALAVTAVLTFGTSAIAAEHITWSSSYHAAAAVARQTHKLMMVDFYTDWCVWCKRLDKDTYPDEKVAAAAGDFVPVKVNAEKEGKEEAAKYKVTGYPTILFIDGDGNLESKIVGYMPPADFAQQLSFISAAHRDFPRLTARYKANPGDMQAAGSLATIYAGRDNTEKAAQLISTVEAKDPHNSRGYLTKAYNKLADSYQNANDFDKAIPLFRKAASTGKDPSDVAYAHMSIAACYIAQNKPDLAKPELEKVTHMQGVSDSDMKQATDMLKGISGGK
jgi:thioredoxin-related protein